MGRRHLIFCSVAEHDARGAEGRVKIAQINSLWTGNCQHPKTLRARTKCRELATYLRESALPALLELSYSSPMPEETKRSDDSDEIERSQQTERGDYEDRLRQLETDVKDLLTLFKHLLNSSPHGEQLLFMTLGRIEEQDAAVEKFNETFRDLVKRKGLE
jgi:hypothetical protein